MHFACPHRGSFPILTDKKRTREPPQPRAEDSIDEIFADPRQPKLVPVKQEDEDAKNHADLRESQAKRFKPNTPPTPSAVRPPSLTLLPQSAFESGPIPPRKRSQKRRSGALVAGASGDEWLTSGDSSDGADPGGDQHDGEWQEGRTDDGNFEIDQGDDDEDDDEAPEDKEGEEFAERAGNEKPENRPKRRPRGSSTNPPEFAQDSPEVITASETVKALNERLPAVCRYPLTSEIIILESVESRMHFAGRAGWILMECTWVFDGKRMSVSDIKEALLARDATRSKNDRLNLTTMDIFVMNGNSPRWLPLREVFSGETRRGAEPLNLDLFIPALPFGLTPQQYEWIRQCDPHERLRQTSLDSSPNLRRLSEAVEFLKPQLPTVIPSRTEGDYGIWYDVEVDFDQCALKPIIEVGGHKYEGFYTVAKPLQEGYAHRNVDRLRLVGSISGGPIHYFQLGRVIPPAVRRGDELIQKNFHLIVPEDLPERAMARVKLHVQAIKAGVDPGIPAAPAPSRRWTAKRTGAAKTSRRRRRRAQDAEDAEDDAGGGGNDAGGGADDVFDVPASAGDSPNAADAPVLPRPVDIRATSPPVGAHSAIVEKELYNEEPPARPRRRPPARTQKNDAAAVVAPEEPLLAPGANPLDGILSECGCLALDEVLLQQLQIQNQEYLLSDHFDPWRNPPPRLFDGVFMENLISHQKCSSHKTRSRAPLLYPISTLQACGTSAHALLSCRAFIGYALECRHSLHKYLMYHAGLSFHLGAEVSGLNRALVDILPHQLSASQPLGEQILTVAKSLCGDSKYESAMELISLWENDLESFSEFRFVCRRCQGRYREDSVCGLCGVRSTATPALSDKHSLRNNLLRMIDNPEAQKLFST